MRNRFRAFLAKETTFDEIFWASMIFIGLYVIQLITDGSIHL